MRLYLLLLALTVMCLAVTGALYNITASYPLKTDVTHPYPTYGFLNPFSPDRIVPAEVDEYAGGWGEQHLVATPQVRWYYFFYDLVLVLTVITVVHGGRMLIRPAAAGSNRRLALLITIVHGLLLAFLIAYAWWITAVISLYY